MPTYDYECDACGHEFELFQSITEPVQKKCPKCGKLKFAACSAPGQRSSSRAPASIRPITAASRTRRARKKISRPANRNRSPSQIPNRIPSQKRRARRANRSPDRIETGFKERQQEREEKIAQVEIALPCADSPTSKRRQPSILPDVITGGTAGSLPTPARRNHIHRFVRHRVIEAELPRVKRDRTQPLVLELLAERHASNRIVRRR